MHLAEGHNSMQLKFRVLRSVTRFFSKIQCVKEITQLNYRQTNEPHHEKSNVVLNRSDTNRAVQAQKMARSLKFQI